MRNVFDFTLENAYQNITLDDVASVANMTKNAFCKYFKKRTNKTFVSFLIELRVENACKLLSTDKDLSINDIAFKSGFNNISNFNRQFKMIKHMSPNKFRKTYL